MALDASQCPGGRGVDFIVDLPEVLTRRVLMSLPGKQLARCQAVSPAWRASAEMSRVGRGLRRQLRVQARGAPEPNLDRHRAPDEEARPVHR